MRGGETPAAKMSTASLSRIPSVTGPFSRRLALASVNGREWLAQREGGEERAASIHEKGGREAYAYLRAPNESTFCLLRTSTRARLATVALTPVLVFARVRGGKKDGRGFFSHRS